MNTPSANTVNQPMELKDKWYFAAYLNMARHNFYIALAELNSRLYPGKKDQTADEGAINFTCVQKLKASNNAPADEQEKIIRELNWRFRWLSAMTVAYATPMSTEPLGPEEHQRVRYNLTSQHYFEVLKLVFDLLNQLRNEYTHYAPQPSQQPPVLAHLLHTCFDAARRTAKERFKYTDAEVAHLVRKGKNGDNRSFHYKLFDQQKRLSTYGVCFFTCLLLEKKYAALFTANIKGLKDRRETERAERTKQASFETFAAFCIQLPNNRVQADDPVIAFGLDMLNELMRCPAALYEVLSLTDQQRFVRTANEADTEEEPLQMVMKRWEDRFPYFFQRFIDEMKLFEEIRFPIDLGNYHFHLYQKMWTNTTARPATMQKIIGWGRLPFFQQADTKPAIYQQLTVTPGTDADAPALPYIVDTRPHYHLEDDNVALRFTNKSERDQWPLVHPYKEGDTGKPFKRLPAHLKISKYELPFFIITALLAKASDPNLKKFEGALKQYYDARKNLYERIANGSFQPLVVHRLLPKPGPTESTKTLSNNYLRRWQDADDLVKKVSPILSLADLQDELRDWIMGIEPADSRKKARQKIEALIADTELRLKRLKSAGKRNTKPGQAGPAAHLKSGRIADFIARDMLWFQPKDTTEKAFGKPTALLFRTLQSKIAYFSVHAATLERTYRDCRLLQSTNPHPFLNKVVRRKAKHLLESYQHYLEERRDYLNYCQQAGNFEQFAWLLQDSNHDRQKAAMQLASNILKDEIPIALPRGFFHSQLKACLQKLNHPALNALLNTPTDKVHNSSFMVLNYHRQVLGDGFQPFYDLNREYKVVNAYYQRAKINRLRQLSAFPTSIAQRSQLKEKIKQWINTLPKAEEPGSTVPGFASWESNANAYKFMEDNEKIIRHEMLKDVALHAMAAYLFSNAFASDIGERFKLSTFNIAADSTVLEERITYSKTIPPVKTKGATPTKPVVVTQEGIKMKNVGDFNRFFKDLRLGSLVVLMEKELVSRQELEEELAAFDTRRTELFYLAQLFEQRTISQHPAADPLSFSSLVEAAALSGHVHANAVKVAATIRNGFSHNHFPNQEELGHAVICAIRQRLKGVKVADVLIDEFIKVLNLSDLLANNEEYQQRFKRQKPTS